MLQYKCLSRWSVHVGRAFHLRAVLGWWRSPEDKDRHCSQQGLIHAKHLHNVSSLPNTPSAAMDQCDARNPPGEHVGWISTSFEKYFWRSSKSSIPDGSLINRRVPGLRDRKQRCFSDRNRYFLLVQNARNQGNFFWRQAYNMKSSNISTLYIAMFDE